MNTKKEDVRLFYLGFDTEGYLIRISPEYREGYLAYEMDRWLNFPSNATRGWYKYIDGELVEDLKKKEEITLLDKDESHRISDELEKINEEKEYNEEIVADLLFQSVEKDREMQFLKKQNAFLEEQLAMEAMESLQKSQKISELKKENEEIQEQVAMETMNGLELEMRVSAIENKIEKDDK